MKNLLYILVFTLPLLSACDIVKRENIYKQKAAVTNKKVLLEIFTGWRCRNCPQGTDDGLNAIKAAGYDKNTVIVKIHAGFFATPSSNLNFDFRSAPGTGIYTSLGIQSNPQGSVNRNKYNGAYSLSTGAWVEKIAETINKDTAYAPLDLGLEVEYSEVNRKISLAATSILTRNINKKIFITAYITEDSIVAPQDLPDETNYKFIHRHVLRGQLDARNGNLILEQGTINQSIKKSFNVYTINDKWNDKHCSLVVIATNEEGEVLQVEEIKVLE